MMASPPTLSAGCVEALLQCRNPDDGISYVVQVLQVNQGVTSKGAKKYTATISDAEHCLDCTVAPQKFLMVEDGIVTKFSVIKIVNVVCNELKDGVMVLLLDMIFLSSHDDVIGKPTYIKKNTKRQLSPSNTAHSSSKSVRSGNIRNAFRNFQHEPEEDSKRINIDNESSVPCENCNNTPCDWTNYGPSIISHINEEYAGRFVDDDGNVMDEFEEGRCDVITNKQLRFLCYSAYSSAKHGYLGKKKCVPIPYCVECGIRLHFPEKNHFYVGFTYAEDS
jgi:hypothetical protein